MDDSTEDTVTETEVKLLLHATRAARVDHADVLKAAGYSQGVIDMAAESLEKQGLLRRFPDGAGMGMSATDEGRRLAQRILGRDDG